MASISFSLVLSHVPAPAEARLRELLCEDLGFTSAEARTCLEELPRTIASGLEEEDAELLAEQLEELGAEVEVLQDEDSDDAEDDLPSEEDEDEDDDLPPPEREASRRKAPLGQRLMMVLGAAILVLLVLLLVFSVAQGRQVTLGSGCSGGPRGAGANSALAGNLPQLAGQFAPGLEPDAGVAHGTLQANSSESLREAIVGTACYVWIAMSPNGTDLDLYLRQNGRLLSSDEADDNFPIVRHCSSQSGEVDLEIKMYTGGGDWVLQRYVLRAREGEDLASVRYRLYANILLPGNGVAPLGQLQQLQLKNGQHRAVPLHLDAQWCYVAMAVGAPDSNVDLVLASADGQELAHDAEPDSFPMVRYCPQASGEFAFRVGMRDGEGTVAFQVYRGPRDPAKPEAAPVAPLKLGLDEPARSP